MNSQFTSHIEKGAAYITGYLGSSSWIETIREDSIHVRRYEGENPLELSIGEYEASELEYTKGVCWMESHGFACSRADGDNRTWAEIAAQLDKEWREWILEQRELIEIAAQAY